MVTEPWASCCRSEIFHGDHMSWTAGRCPATRAETSHSPAGHWSKAATCSLQDVPESEFLAAAPWAGGQVVLWWSSSAESRRARQREGRPWSPALPIQTPGHSFIHSSTIMNTTPGHARRMSRNRQDPRAFYAARGREKTINRKQIHQQDNIQ